MARAKLTPDEVSTYAKLMGVPPALALAIWGQESGGKTDAATSPKGAVGAFQVIPSTFKQYNPRGNINDPVDNMHAALGYMSDLLKRYNGDWEKVAQAYYHGSALLPGQRGPTSGLGTPDTRAYGEQVMARVRKNDPMAQIATAPATATSTASPTPPTGAALFGGYAATPVSAPTTRTRATVPTAPPGPWMDPMWHALTAQNNAPPQLGQLGPTDQPQQADAGDQQQMLAQGGEQYEQDEWIRKLVDEIV